MNEHTAECECGTVEKLAANPRSPIKFDETLNEYNLVAGVGRVHYRMYFCFFCGGKLPESTRASQFAQPSEHEMKQVAELMSKADSMAQVIQLLGNPDETVKAPKTAADQNGQFEYKNHHRYVRRWKTLDLTIRERKDGSIDSAFTGKYKGESRHGAKKTQRLS